MSRKKKSAAQPESELSAVEKAEQAGREYVHAQFNEPYFQDYVWQQMVEGDKMRRRDPASVIDDPKEIAKNMLQQMRWDIHRDLEPREILPLIDTGEEEADERELVKAFFSGLDEVLYDKKVRDWLANMVTEMDDEIRTGAPPEQTQLPGVLRGREPYRGGHRRELVPQPQPPEPPPFPQEHRRHRDLPYGAWIAEVASIMERRGDRHRFADVTVVYWRQAYNAGLSPEQAVDEAIGAIVVRGAKPVAHGSTAQERRDPRRGSHSAVLYEVTAGADILYSGNSLREAQERYDDAVHKNYEGMGYVDEVIEIRADGHVIRSFGPGTFRPHYFNPKPQWVDKGVTGTGRMRRAPAPRRR